MTPEKVLRSKPEYPRELEGPCARYHRSVLAIGRDGKESGEEDTPLGSWPPEAHGKYGQTARTWVVHAPTGAATR